MKEESKSEVHCPDMLPADRERRQQQDANLSFSIDLEYDKNPNQKMIDMQKAEVAWYYGQRSQVRSQGQNLFAKISKLRARIDGTVENRGSRSAETTSMTELASRTFRDQKDLTKMASTLVSKLQLLFKNATSQQIGGSRSGVKDRWFVGSITGLFKDYQSITLKKKEFPKTAEQHRDFQLFCGEMEMLILQSAALMDLQIESPKLDGLLPGKK